MRTFKSSQPIFGHKVTNSSLRLKRKLFHVPVPGAKKNYRVIYEINDKVLPALVLEIRDRKEIYRY